MTRPHAQTCQETYKLCAVMLSTYSTTCTDIQALPNHQVHLFKQLQRHRHNMYLQTVSYAPFVTVQFACMPFGLGHSLGAKRSYNLFHWHLWVSPGHAADVHWFNVGQSCIRTVHTAQSCTEKSSCFEVGVCHLGKGLQHTSQRIVLICLEC